MDSFQTDSEGGGPAAEGWFRLFCCDVARHREYRNDASVLNILFNEQSLWALLHYRIASAVYRKPLPGIVKRPVMMGLALWQKLIEILTGISISPQARIGRGFCIWHFGNVFIGPGVRIGEMCNVSPGVMLGVSGSGADRGSPTLGNRIYVGSNAVVAGRIFVGDDAAIAANSLVSRTSRQKLS